MLLVIAMFGVGMFLSAFFSGTETGFYRATRTRLALDALDGDQLSEGLLWLANNPTLFVATTLVGNNFANYLTSWSLVLGTTLLWSADGNGIELAVSIFASPFIFIYGELMPKNMFFRAPNRLLRRASPFILLFTVLFSPLAAILWLLGRLIEIVIGVAPERIQLRLVRSGLRRVLSEGHEAGVLQPNQRQMADGMFEVAALPLEKFCIPTSKLAIVDQAAPRELMLSEAKRMRTPAVILQDHRKELVGYIRVVDFYFHPDATPPVESLSRIPRRASSITALTSLQEEDQAYAAVVGDNGRVMGMVGSEQLAEAILNASR